MTVIESLEGQRLAIQHALDAAKSQIERNRLGQFATPPPLASAILEYARALVPEGAPVRFLDPALGTGSFYSALLRTFTAGQIERAEGYEIDPHYGHAAISLWQNTPLTLHLADFTRASPPSIEHLKPNLLICNPPYVRHHHLATEDKARLQGLAEQTAGVHLSGLAGLYCYFLLLCHAWLAEDGLAGWLVPSEFMDVNYGREVKRYLLERVTLARIHRFAPENMQFGDALVSSVVVWFWKRPPPVGHTVEFTYGGTLARPHHSKQMPSAVLRGASKWTQFPLAAVEDATGGHQVQLGDLFEIKRGVATGANSFFILDAEAVAAHDIPAAVLRPILPSPQRLPIDEVEADASGTPVLGRQLFLLSCELPESDVQAQHPSLWTYLQRGVAQGIHERYLCLHRSPWYAQERRPPAMFLCTYMGRQNTRSGRAFRFILNHSRATAPNVYLMLYPKLALHRLLEADPRKRRAVWQALNAIDLPTLIGKGRVYGGGLHKLEPKELGRAPAEGILAGLNGALHEPVRQMGLFAE